MEKRWQCMPMCAVSSAWWKHVSLGTSQSDGNRRNTDGTSTFVHCTAALPSLPRWPWACKLARIGASARRKTRFEHEHVPAGSRGTPWHVLFFFFLDHHGIPIGSVGLGWAKVDLILVFDAAACLGRAGEDRIQRSLE